MQRRRGWKHKGRKVVFTNGCFDILHPGHIRLLQKARSLGDVLVVGLNSDGSVRRLKGPGRPVQPARARAEILAALECVDAIVFFGKATPARLLASLQPDVLVKGADYEGHQIVGRGNAGRVVRVPLARGHSTSGIIRKIRRTGR